MLITGILIFTFIVMWLISTSGSPSRPTVKKIVDLEPVILHKMEDQIKVLNRTIHSLQEQIARIPSERKKEFFEALTVFANELEHKTKEKILKEIFGDPPANYDRSVEFEKLEGIYLYEGRKAELDLREIRQEMKEGQLSQDQKIQNFIVEFWEKYSNMREYLIERFSTLEMEFTKQLNEVNLLVGKFQQELNERIGDLELKTGKEVLRIEDQQRQILNKLDNYENKIKAIALEVEQAKVEVASELLKAEELVSRSKILYDKHKNDLMVLSRDLETALQEIALDKRDFANTVGQAKLSLDAAVQKVHFALKDMAYERIGINKLREEYQLRSEQEQERLQDLIAEQHRLNREIQERISHNQEVAGLKHRLYMTQERLEHSRNRADLLQREYSIVRRLTA